jgi:hypothetical protein
MDFLTKTKMQIDFAVRRYAFGFCPTQEFNFESLDLGNATPQKFPGASSNTTSPLCGSLPQEMDQPVELTK